MERNVLIVITTAFTKYGGLTGVVMNCLRQMDISDIKISIVSGNVPEEELLNECNSIGIKYIQIYGRNRNTFKYIFNLSRVLKSYDVIHIHSNSATAVVELIAAKLARVKVRIVQNHTEKCDHYILNKLCYPLFKKLYTYGISCSKKAGDWIFGKGNYTILNNSIDTERYMFNKICRDTIRVQYGLSDDVICVGHVGKIYKPKNHRFLLEIFRDYHIVVSNSKLLLVGDGVMRKEIEHYVDELGLQDSVIFAGMQPNVNEFLSAFDMFVFPSLWEGMPLSVIEAQAAGLPCFISDTIDEDVAITKLVSRLPINKGTEIWVEKLKNTIERNRFENSKNSISQLKSNKYDSKVSAKVLKDLYL